MKARESLVRLKEFQVREKQRQLNQLQMMMAEFERMTKDLENQIIFEEKKSGISDPQHFAYPTFAKAARSSSGGTETSLSIGSPMTLICSLSLPATLNSRSLSCAIV